MLQHVGETGMEMIVATTKMTLRVKIPTWRLRTARVVGVVFFCLGGRWWPDWVADPIVDRIARWVGRGVRFEPDA